MNDDRLRELRSALTYGLLMLSAAWLIWTAMEVRYLQGWSEAQGVERFYYPYREIIAGALALVAGAMLARSKWWPAAVIAAILVLALTQVFWIGYTR